VGLLGQSQGPCSKNSLLCTVHSVRTHPPSLLTHTSATAAHLPPLSVPTSRSGSSGACRRGVVTTGCRSYTSCGTCSPCFCVAAAGVALVSVLMLEQVSARVHPQVDVQGARACAGNTHLQRLQELQEARMQGHRLILAAWRCLLLAGGLRGRSGLRTCVRVRMVGIVG